MNKELETAVNLGWTASKNETNFGIGCKFALDKDAWVRAKINNSSQVGLGYQQKLRDGTGFFPNFFLTFRLISSFPIYWGPSERTKQGHHCIFR